MNTPITSAQQWRLEKLHKEYKLSIAKLPTTKSEATKLITKIYKAIDEGKCIRRKPKFINHYVALVSKEKGKVEARTIQAMDSTMAKRYADSKYTDMIVAFITTDIELAKKKLVYLEQAIVPQDNSYVEYCESQSNESYMEIGANGKVDENSGLSAKEVAIAEEKASKYDEFLEEFMEFDTDMLKALADTYGCGFQGCRGNASKARKLARHCSNM